MIKNIILAVLVSFLLTAMIGPRMLPMLMKLKFGQFVREDGPSSHLKKSGTPTMGGLIFISGILLSSLVFASVEKSVMPLLFMTIGFAVVGFVDDLLKIKKKKSEGLKAYQKLLLQGVCTLFFLAYVYFEAEIGTKVYLPFTNKYLLDLGLLYYPLMAVVILGTVNGVNLTDGLDGLATSVTSVVAAFFIGFSLLFSSQISIFSAIVLGALLGFLLINVHPAKVFMGDTGSLALGGFVAASAILAQIPLLILLFGSIYLIESISVILQVAYYKKTKKRIFKMAPIHHHFELSGMSETQIVAFFSVITMVMSLIAILSLL
ncbi:MAG: phospho-N-acetylmuramoyl-pentapeptide-transferase [Vallitaleaceae bacterium]|nr:phospho-N-acetylmuramoyl-pentapeptide-transferase [Vallitaleaceae bacterium]